MTIDQAIPGHITGLYIFAVVNLFALFHVSLVAGEVKVINVSNNSTIERFDDLEASFGGDVPEEGILGKVVYVNPRNACKPVARPPEDDNGPWIALIARGSCDFSLKVLNAQKSDYDFAIVHNFNGDDRLIHMGGGPYGTDVRIPAVFVGSTAGVELAKNDYHNQNIRISVTRYPSPDYRLYLWPFAVVVGTCFCLMIIFMCVKICRDRRRQIRSRLPIKALKKIPIKKFKKGDHYDVCAICLEEYEEGEKLRILPCSHAYHTKCIDPWLTKSKKTCPVCKRRVIPGDDNNSDSDSDQETNGNERADERTPLLQRTNRAPNLPNRHPDPSSSLFDNSGLPENARSEVANFVTVPIQHEGDEEESEEEEEMEEGAVGGVDIPHDSQAQNTTETKTGVNNKAFHEEEVPAPSKAGREKRELNQVV